MIVIVLVFIACQSPARLVQLIWGYTYSDCKQVAYRSSSGIARIWREGGQVHLKLFVAFKMTRKNTLNENALISARVAATEPPQMLSQNTNLF